MSVNVHLTAGQRLVVETAYYSEGFWLVSPPRIRNWRGIMRSLVTKGIAEKHPAAERWRLTPFGENVHQRMRRGDL